MLYAIKQATYNLVYNDVKNLAQILSCCKCIHSVFNERSKTFISER